MTTIIESIERAQLREIPEFSPGDRVKVHFQVIEGTRRRIQLFEGIVIKRQGSGLRETFTVRKQSFGVGVERTFPVHSPKIERIEVAARGEVRRAKLYYLRGRVGKRARVRERAWTGQSKEQRQQAELAAERDAAASERAAAEAAETTAAEATAVGAETPQSPATEVTTSPEAPAEPAADKAADASEQGTADAADAGAEAVAEPQAADAGAQADAAADKQAAKDEPADKS